jgi:two-component system, LytTR family, sensor histidine kinase AgrC
MRKKPNIGKTFSTVIILSVVQVIAISVIFAIINFNNENSLLGLNTSTLALLVIIVLFPVFLNLYITIKNNYQHKYSDSQLDLLKDTLQQVETLNKTLRAQRHDFMNHLQVVYSLMEMEEYTEAKAYIDKVYADIQKVARILKTSNPAINALLQAKMLSCEKRQIETELLVTSKLDNIKIPSWELCKILGNIVDNSISALEEVSGKRLLAIELYENVSAFGIRVRNNGPVIGKDYIDKIFKAGFTTKGEKGEGMGLAITKETLEEYGGNINVSSNPNETIFEVSIPK